jgi:hypothetical protein
MLGGHTSKLQKAARYQLVGSMELLGSSQLLFVNRDSYSLPSRQTTQVTSEPILLSRSTHCSNCNERTDENKDSGVDRKCAS